MSKYVSDAIRWVKANHVGDIFRYGSLITGAAALGHEWTQTHDAVAAANATAIPAYLFSFGELLNEFTENYKDSADGSNNALKRVGRAMSVWAPVAYALEAGNPVYRPLVKIGAVVSWGVGKGLIHIGEKLDIKKRKGYLREARKHGADLGEEIYAELNTPEKEIDAASHVFTTRRARQILVESISRNVSRPEPRMDAYLAAHKPDE